MTALDHAVTDTADLRKARGAFFTPGLLCDYVVRWAIRTGTEQVLEPACGEAAFLVAAADRFRALGVDDTAVGGLLHGIELHPGSATRALSILALRGYTARVDTDDFFLTDPVPRYDVVVGNPPYVRYQDFVGEPRRHSKAAALRAGVGLTNLASSWAAFTVHASLFLRREGRLGLVLPAELLTVNYAAPVRRFLMQHFRRVSLVLFTERVFPGVMEEVVLLLAEGFGEGSAGECEIIQARNLDQLSASVARRWRPDTPDGKWTPSLMAPNALDAYAALSSSPNFATLERWGDTTLGMVTGNNRYFALPADKVRELGLSAGELLHLSPPGSRHLRGLTFTKVTHEQLTREGAATALFRPPQEPSRAAQKYIATGEELGVERAYKCRVRTPWWRVPLVPPADLFVTYMNADTPRLCTNRARVHNLNSVHGLYLRPGIRQVGMDLLPLAALNSLTLVAAETVGRAYGGGMLKLEPKEADRLPVPSPEALAEARRALIAIRPQVAARLRRPTGLLEAVRLIDDVMLVGVFGAKRTEVKALRESHAELSGRRAARERAAKGGKDR